MYDNSFSAVPRHNPGKVTHLCKLIGKGNEGHQVLEQLKSGEVSFLADSHHMTPEPKRMSPNFTSGILVLRNESTSATHTVFRITEMI